MTERTPTYEKTVKQ